MSMPLPVAEDNTSDESNEHAAYKYPDFEKFKHPYWQALTETMRSSLKEHDRLELDILEKYQMLDFKVRQAWTVTDKPYYKI